MSEFSLIDQYCRDIGVSHPNTIIGVGDDAAVLQVPEGMQLTCSVDTMVAGIHFNMEVNPAALAHKLLAVNVSDMAAMGAQARWATIALTVPKMDDEWLQGFSGGLDTAAKHFDVELIGGDTTQGPLTLSLQILGLVCAGCAVQRSGAQVGDKVFCTGTLGDAALALKLQESAPNSLQSALHLPQPPVSLGSKLPEIASAAIDVSDGLVADLQHVSRASEVTIVIDEATLPLSDEYRAYENSAKLALYGGDDYQLVFTCGAAKQDRAMELAEKLDTSITLIGIVEPAQAHPVFILADGTRTVPLAKSGYDHFYATG